ncbi:hypothetical protein LHYA1_G007703 [Lachnellula hyalina]|uniref:MARVEL domain-containing protein n=1 Tax=Lachnellula hyalina TaxID=1316788 RepID=A0A8H8QWV8_9HELO|nr:uncharacterized protein LHYA1_G007703 [Lachnellula hyalina]TVY24153.1 hypothetical protein LHYA1_G007703 [Lachnellula hyalina]
MQPIVGPPPQPYNAQYSAVPQKLEQPQQLETEKMVLHGQLESLKTKVKTLRMFSRAISTALNMVLFAFMAFVIATFYATRNDTALGRTIWPEVNPKVWPTIMLLASSLITFLMSLSVLCFYCFCFKRASESWKLVVATYVIHIGVWLVVTILYRQQKALNDIWGWSCTQIATKLQDEGHSRVNFQQLCKIQSVSWVLSIIETSLKIVFGIGYFFFYRKVREVSAKRTLANTMGEGAEGLLNAIF